MHSHMTCFIVHHWSVLDVSCFARKQERTEAVLQQNGNFKQLFERDVRYFGKNELYCMEAMGKHYVLTQLNFEKICS